MKKNLIWLLILVFTVSMAIASVGCKTEEAQEAEEVSEEVQEEEEVSEEVAKDMPLTIIMSADALNEGIENMFARFTEDTGWQIEMESIPGAEEYQTIVPARLTSGEGPDLVWGHGTPSEYLIYNPTDNFLDITDWVTENMLDIKINKSLIDVNAVNGKTYGIPINPPTLRGYYYNKNILEDVGVELPVSALDFLNNVAPKIRAAGYDPIYGMGQDMWGFGFEADNFVADEFVNTDIQDRINSNEATFSDSAYVRAFKWQKALQDSGYYNDDLLVGTYDGAVQAVTDGTAFMTLQSVGTMGRYAPEVHEYLGGLSLSEEGNRGYYSLPHYMYIVNETAGAGNQEAAIAFYEWFIEEDNLSQFYSDLKAPSVYMGIENEMFTYAQDLKAAFDAQTPYVSQLQANPKMTGTYSAMVVAGTASPLGACEQMQADFIDSAKAIGLEAYQE